MTLQFLSIARAMRSALVNRLYYAVCAMFMGVLSTGSSALVAVAIGTVHSILNGLFFTDVARGSLSFSLSHSLRRHSHE